MHTYLIIELLKCVQVETVFWEYWLAIVLTFKSALESITWIEWTTNCCFFTFFSNQSLQLWIWEITLAGKLRKTILLWNRINRKLSTRRPRFKRPKNYPKGKQLHFTAILRWLEISSNGGNTKFWADINSFQVRQCNLLLFPVIVPQLQTSLRIYCYLVYILCCKCRTFTSSNPTLHD